MATDHEKNKKQLIKELQALRVKLAELEQPKLDQAEQKEALGCE